MANGVSDTGSDIASAWKPSLDELAENSHRFIHEIWPDMQGSRKVQLANALHLVGEGNALQIGAAAGGNVTMSFRAGSNSWTSLVWSIVNEPPGSPFYRLHCCHHCRQITFA